MLLAGLLKLDTDMRWLALSYWRFLSYRNQSMDLQSESMDWFLYDRNLRNERINPFVLNVTFLYLLKTSEILRVF